MQSTGSYDPSNFRANKAVDLWSAQIVGEFSQDELEAAIAASANVDHQRYSGFIGEDDESVGSFTRTRYPRPKYGITPLEDCEKGTKDLAERLGASVLPETQTTGYRIVLGLLEGYDTDAVTHSVDEVQDKLGSQVSVVPARVLAIAPTNEGISKYSEPVAIVRGHQGTLPKVCLLADEFKQERFTIEDFDTRLAWVVETRHCSEPD